MGLKPKFVDCLALSENWPRGYPSNPILYYHTPSFSDMFTIPIAMILLYVRGTTRITPAVHSQSFTLLIKYHIVRPLYRNHRTCISSVFIASLISPYHIRLSFLAHSSSLALSAKNVPKITQKPRHSEGYNPDISSLLQPSPPGLSTSDCRISRPSSRSCSGSCLKASRQPRRRCWRKRKRRWPRFWATGDGSERNR